MGFHGVKFAGNFIKLCVVQDRGKPEPDSLLGKPCWGRVIGQRKNPAIGMEFANERERMVPNAD